MNLEEKEEKAERLLLSAPVGVSVSNSVSGELLSRSFDSHVLCKCHGNLPPVKVCVCYSLCGEGISLGLAKFSSVVRC